MAAIFFWQAAVSDPRASSTAGTCVGCFDAKASLACSDQVSWYPSRDAYSNSGATSRRKITGIVAGTTYYVVSATANTFEIAATPGNRDGITTFNVPDWRGRTAFGLDDLGGINPAGRVTAAGSGVYGTTPGASGGEEPNRLTIAEMPSHDHGSGNGDAFLTDTPAGAEFQSGTHDGGGTLVTSNAGGDGAHNNMPPTLMTNYIIKYC